MSDQTILKYLLFLLLVAGTSAVVILTAIAVEIIRDVYRRWRH